MRDAIVADIRGDRALLDVTSAGHGCGPCEAGTGCGVGLLERHGEREHHLDVVAGDLVVGQRVKVSVTERSINAGALSLYGWPLLGLILGTGLFATLGGASVPSDLAGLLGAAVGLSLGLKVASNAASSHVRVHADGRSDDDGSAS